MRAWSTLLLIISGLYGAAGVALSAYAAHLAGGENLTTAAQFLLFHAALIAALSVNPPQGRTALVSGSIIALGTLLFSGDLTLRVVAGVKIWAMAAPTGGSLLILGWLSLAGWGIARFLRRDA
jgi:uncharacterized membrane protein YgdD (TMEM256/DUF423 family)